MISEAITNVSAVQPSTDEQSTKSQINVSNCSEVPSTNSLAKNEIDREAEELHLELRELKMHKSPAIDVTDKINKYNRLALLSIKTKLDVDMGNCIKMIEHYTSILSAEKDTPRRSTIESIISNTRQQKEAIQRDLGIVNTKLAKTPT